MPAKHIVLQPLAPQDLAIKWWGFLDPQSWPNRPSSHCMLWFPQLQHMKTVPASIGLNFHWLFQGAKNQITPKAERWHVFLFNVLRECHDVFESEFLNSLWFRTHRLLMDPHRPSNQHSGEGTHAKDQEFIYMRQFTVRPKKIATRALHFPLGYLIQSTESLSIWRPTCHALTTDIYISYPVLRCPCGTSSNPGFFPGSSTHSWKKSSLEPSKVTW